MALVHPPPNPAPHSCILGAVAMHRSLCCSRLVLLHPGHPTLGQDSNPGTRSPLTGPAKEAVGASHTPSAWGELADREAG